MSRAADIDWQRFDELGAWGLSLRFRAEAMGINEHTLSRRNRERGQHIHPERPEVDWAFVHAQRRAGVPWASIAGSRSYSWMCNEYHRRLDRGEFRFRPQAPSLRRFTWQEAA